MGKVMSLMAKPIKNFNIEARAHKVISKNKPTPAPKYQANIEEAEKILQENPDSMKDLLKKDSKLDSHLREVYVKSHDILIETKTSENIDRPLPLNRKIVQQFEFGFHEPVSVPIGRCTLRQALKFLTNHQEDADNWNSAKIALEYKIPEDKIGNILHYFRIYKVYIPEKSKLVIAEPSIPKKRIQNNPIQSLIDEQKEK